MKSKIKFGISLIAIFVIAWTIILEQIPKSEVKKNQMMKARPINQLGDWVKYVQKT